MMKTLPIILCAFLVLIFLGCSYDPASVAEEQPEIQSNSNLNRFYIFGDTFASGFMDGALYAEGQKNSFGSIVALKLDEAFKKEEFKQFQIEAENGSNDEFLGVQENPGRFEIYFPTPTFIYPYRGLTQGSSTLSVVNENDEIRDFSLPKAKSFELSQANNLSTNTYYQAMYSGSETPFSRLVNSNPGVVLMFLGMEDVFNFASEGASENMDATPQSITTNGLLSVAEFESVYQQYITELLNQTDADVIVCTLFDPLIAPYFKTISRAFEPDIYPPSYVGNLSFFYNELITNIAAYHIENGLTLYQARPQLDFDTENWPNTSARFRSRVLVDENIPIFQLLDGTQIPNYRTMFNGELIPYKYVEQLSPDSDFSGTRPLEDNEVVILEEISSIRFRVSSYNDIIKDIADSNPRIKLLDVGRIIERVNQGSVQFDRVRYTTNFDRNTIFSADGYSLNARGNAVIARELIELINEEYQVNLSLINPNQYKGLNYRLD